MKPDPDQAPPSAYIREWKMPEQQQELKMIYPEQKLKTKGK